MRVLWVTDEVPDPALGGGSIRQYHLLRGLAERTDCDLLLTGTLTDGALRARLGRVVEVAPGAATAPGGVGLRVRLTTHLLFGRAPLEVVDNQAVREALAPVLADLVAGGNHDLVHFEHGYLAPLVEVVRGATGPGGPACEIGLQYLSSVRAAQTAAVGRRRRDRWFWAAEARRGRRLERGLGGRFDRVIVASPEDGALLPFPVTCVPNGVDLAAFPPTPLPAAPRLLFSGHLGYGPNIDGSTWFCGEVLPEVRRRVPGARLSLVGRSPAPEVRALAGIDGVDAHFDVPAIQPHLQAARVSVVPLRAGSGTRLKALEAMASGRPLAGTTIGLEGLGLTDGGSAVIRDDPAELAAGIARLLTDDDAAERQRGAAASLAADFDWDRIVERYLDEIGHEVQR